ncbi:MAG: PHP domain-containing protein [Candidatus Woesearchaeota archaeon]|jgi:hypothetical protein|nr:PHP domain-containing protein [Candidatus Woesearchaeota archaeon]MDP7506672.1 PHP domain-containing protein [Candidatus Woesearchaeota archaeon]MDP7610724.1 PHP domain-containing protein [Candidatus Woesearchaeota archaeon]|tara:strand:+ start:2216 stop:2863 length:648 start_codon:yes stop_codon:yes gene_type:complete
MPKKYDLHIHSVYSRDSSLKPKVILKLAKERGLDGIAVTDHNSIKGGVVTSKLNKDKDFEVIIGSEIKTKQCEVLGYYLQEEIKSKDLLEVLDKIKEQGGFSVIAHPFTIIPRLNLRYPLNEIKEKVDGLEAFNSRSVFPFENKRAFNAAEKYKLAMTGSSDSHSKIELGRAFTIFDGELRTAIAKRKTRAEGLIRYSKIGRLCTLHYKLFKFFY